jgi:EmrB/QacA subfamily drug resistance transporter
MTATAAGQAPAEPVRLATRQGRLVLAATVLGSGVAMLDATVVNVALPRIGEDLDTGLAGLQWTVNAYTLTLAGLLLLGGALGDRHGRRRVFVAGVVWFAAASLLCAVAPTAALLVAARALQGVGAALLTPGSLAILEATFHRDDRAAAIGAWSGLGGVTTAAGPFLGGWLVDSGSWRLIFLLNLPLAAAVVWIAQRHVPETRGPAAVGRLDVEGAVLAALALAGVSWALIEGPGRGWDDPAVLAALVVGCGSVAAFLARERRAGDPMLPLGVFSSRQFSAANAVTFVVYGALGASMFLLPIQLQRVVGFSAVAAGTSLLPLTVLMLLLSARAGRLAGRIGPRLPMAVGPLVAGVGLALLVRVGAGSTYAADVLPAVVVFGLGLSLTVAPLTATVLAAAPTEHAGVASAVNNGVARTASLLAVAAVPTVAGIGGGTSGAADPAAFSDGFHTAALVTAGLCVAGGVLAAATIRNPRPADQPAEAPAEEHPHHCPLDAPPLRRSA